MYRDIWLKLCGNDNNHSISYDKKERKITSAGLNLCNKPISDTAVFRNSYILPYFPRERKTKCFRTELFLYVVSS